MEKAELKLLEEIHSMLKKWQEWGPSINSDMLRGPVADPAPEWSGNYFFTPRELLKFRGPVGDPAPYHLLDKAKLAELKVHRLNTAIAEMEKQIESFKIERDLYKKEYKL